MNFVGVEWNLKLGESEGFAWLVANLPLSVETQRIVFSSPKRQERNLFLSLFPLELILMNKGLR